MKMTAEKKKIIDFFGFKIVDKKILFKDKELNEDQIRKLKSVIYILDYRFEVNYKSVNKNIYMFDLFKYMKDKTQLTNKEIISVCSNIFDLITSYKVKEIKIDFPLPKAIENIINSLKLKQQELPF